MVALSSSACPPMPIRLSARSAFSSAEGSGIATLGSLRKPLLVPSCATATSIPFDSAARNPPAASLELSASSAAEIANAVPSDESASAVRSGRRCRRAVRVMSQCRLRSRQNPSGHARGLGPTRMSDGETSFENIIERERGLRRSLSARRMTMIAIGGAIGTGLFLGSGFAISLAGPGVLVSYAVGAIIALLLMGCLAEMTVAHPTSGSFGAYAEYYIDPLAGFLVRYAYWTGNVLAVGPEVTAVALYMHFWFPSLPGWLSIVAFSGLLIPGNPPRLNVFAPLPSFFSPTTL